MATLMLTVLPGELFGVQVVTMVDPPEGAPQRRGVTMLEMSVEVQV